MNWSIEQPKRKVTFTMGVAGPFPIDSDTGHMKGSLFLMHYQNADDLF